MTIQTQSTKPSMRIFFMVWIGQVVSVIGSGLTGFALVVWTYSQTQSVLQTSLVVLAQQIPSIVVAPFAGVLVDRWDRRHAMIFGDLLAGLGTIAVVVLLSLGMFEIWHIYVVSSLYAISRVFREPAYTAATTLLVPQEHYGRANGLVQIATAVSTIAAPVIAGALLAFIGLEGILLIDCTTFVFALVMLLIVRFPKAEHSAETGTKGSFWQEVKYGWSYLVTHSGMLSLMLLFLMVNFVAGFINVLIVPLVLSFTTSVVLGTIASASGTGALLGSIAMSAWGGPKRRVYGVISAVAVLGAMLAVMGLSANPLLVGVGAFGVLFAVPIMQGCNQALLQSKVPAHVQGRVFATQKMIALLAMPISTLLAGPLADRVFEPMLAAEGALAGSVGQIIGVGPGRGIAFLYIVMGLILVLVAAAALLYPRLRRMEDELPNTAMTMVPAEV